MKNENLKKTFEMPVFIDVLDPKEKIFAQIDKMNDIGVLRTNLKILVINYLSEKELNKILKK